MVAQYFLVLRDIESHKVIAAIPARAINNTFYSLATVKLFLALKGDGIDFLIVDSAKAYVALLGEKGKRIGDAPRWGSGITRKGRNQMRFGNNTAVPYQVFFRYQG